jgi:hypothetical protein
MSHLWNCRPESVLLEVACAFSGEVDCRLFDPKFHILYFVSGTGVGKYCKDMILSVEMTVQESIAGI